MSKNNEHPVLYVGGSGYDALRVHNDFVPDPSEDPIELPPEAGLAIQDKLNTDRPIIPLKMFRDSLIAYRDLQNQQPTDGMWGMNKSELLARAQQTLAWDKDQDGTSNACDQGLIMRKLTCRYIIAQYMHGHGELEKNDPRIQHWNLKTEQVQ